MPSIVRSTIHFLLIFASLRAASYLSSTFQIPLSENASMSKVQPTSNLSDRPPNWEHPSTTAVDIEDMHHIHGSFDVAEILRLMKSGVQYFSIPKSSVKDVVLELDVKLTAPQKLVDEAGGEEAFFNTLGMSLEMEDCEVVGKDGGSICLYDVVLAAPEEVEPEKDGAHVRDFALHRMFPDQRSYRMIAKSGGSFWYEVLLPDYGPEEGKEEGKEDAEEALAVASKEKTDTHSSGNIALLELVFVDHAGKRHPGPRRSFCLETWSKKLCYEHDTQTISIDEKEDIIQQEIEQEEKMQREKVQQEIQHEIEQEEKGQQEILQRQNLDQLKEELGRELQHFLIDKQITFYRKDSEKDDDNNEEQGEEFPSANGSWMYSISDRDDLPQEAKVVPRY